MATGNKERGLVNMQVSPEVHTAITILRERYGVRSLTDTLAQFITECEPKLMESAKQIVSQKSDAAKKSDKPE